MGLPAVATAVKSAYDAIPDGAKSKAINWLSQSTGGAVNSVAKLASFAGKSEANAAVVAEGLVRFGAPVEVIDQLFSSTPNGAAIRASLRSVSQNLRNVADGARPGVNASNTDTANDVLRSELVRSLVRAFGSTEAAQKVQMALSTLRQEDFDWYRAVVMRG